MKKLFCILYFCNIISVLLYQQDFTLGWQGDSIVPENEWLNASNWTVNHSDGESGSLSTDTAVHLTWKFGAGSAEKWIQCYIAPETPVDLSDMNVIGIDIRGKEGTHWARNVELKFEDGTVSTAYTWENLAHIDRWCEKLIVLHKQFPDHDIIRWDSITIVSFAVTMNSWDNTDIQADSGKLSFSRLIAANTDSFTRTVVHEPLSGFEVSELEDIKVNALNALKNRQTETGLLTTWIQDGSSWLYGQGLALKIFTEEGLWNASEPADEYATAAEKLSHFLTDHQDSEGFWPRAWDAATGDIIVYLEGNQTVWMGDFPWIPGSLACYYKKTGDAYVLPAILKARSFLFNLIDPSGRVNTININTSEKTEVSNYEGYAAALYCLLELGETSKASTVMEYLMDHGWDADLKYWREGPESMRPVLLVNTWLASLFSEAGYTSEPLDALSLAGKILYTTGPGEPGGLDGVGPVATWFEGTSSYISAEGPGSNELFNGISGFINPDGTVPAYNDSLGGMAGIWAVEWSSLDATSWLYYAAAQKSPFQIVPGDPDLFTSVTSHSKYEDILQLNIYDGVLFVNGDLITPGYDVKIDLYTLSGVHIGSTVLNASRQQIKLQEINPGYVFQTGVYIGVCHYRDAIISKKIIYL